MTKASEKQESNSDWFANARKPIIIAGPCSAETRDQVFDTANQLLDFGKIDLFRAGIWKPRTQPDSFEGVGKIGLPWLRDLRDETGLQITVEVAKASHVELCLEHNIDVLWIGARTTVNPFAVQEIADALRGVDIPVMIKNPINPDLSLWTGAVQRIRNSGLKDIAVIHRGFSYFGENFYRNRPMWQIAIEFMRRHPEIPMICDPSHICGRRDILFDVSQKAMDLDYDGLMIETHIDPDNAWSDAMQQITPEVFASMMSSIEFRSDHQDNKKLQSKLEQLRDTIDHIDEEIINLLANRMLLARDIGKYKKDNNMTIYQARRWNEIIERSLNQASKTKLSKEFILKYINTVHDESIDQQEQVMKKMDD